MDERSPEINSRDYWDARFASDWEENLGRHQTRYFTEIACRTLPKWLVDDINGHSMTVCDIGCAEGDSMPILKAVLYNAKLSGIDFSANSIALAQKYYAGYEFITGDINTLDELFDVVFCSNMIEHFHDPVSIMKKVVDASENHAIFMLPFQEENLMPEHFSRFDYMDIPKEIGVFKLVYFSIYDCRNDTNPLFLAKQILLVYTKNEQFKTFLDVSSEYALHMDLYEAERKIVRISAEAEVARNEAEVARNEAEVARNEAEAARNEAEAARNEAEAARNEAAKNEIEAQSKTEFLQAELANTKKDASAQADCLDDVRTQVNELAQLQETLIAQLAEAQNQKSISDLNTLSLSSKLNELYGSRTWRTANLMKKIAYKTGLLYIIKVMLFFKNKRFKGLSEGVSHRFKIKKDDHPTERVSPTVIAESIDPQNADANDLYSQEIIQHRTALYNQVLNSEWSETTQTVWSRIKGKSYLGIIVYPHATHWSPVQRPQHLLSKFAKRGYLCFFCEDQLYAESCVEIEENLFIVRGEEHLLPLLQDKHVLILITYYQQTIFSGFIPHKTVHFDILDRLDFFSGDGNISRGIYKNLIANSDIVTYSADALREYVDSRPDAIRLPNGVNTEDFVLTMDTSIPILDDIEKIAGDGKPIIGYYGAVEEWLDVDLVKAVADGIDCHIVIIGHIGIDPERLRAKNIHLLGPKEYTSLKYYASFFDISIIPFIVSDLTNSVSPVKFFEYCAAGKAVVSTPIREMLQYESEGVHLCADSDEFITTIQHILENGAEAVGRRNFAIAAENRWETRVDAIIESLYRSSQGLKVFSNRFTWGECSVFTITFFDFEGTNYYSGGAERYLIDLDNVLRDMGHKMTVYQYASHHWVRKYGNLEVVGLCENVGDVDRVITVERTNSTAALFTRISNQSSLSIYSPFFLAESKSNPVCIGISHGVAWDDDQRRFTDLSPTWNSRFILGANVCDKIVSVDTNTANWFQTVDYPIGNAMEVISNYVDNDEFSPRENFLEPGDPIVILYPRRLYAPRGLYMVLDIIDPIFQQYPDVEFHFVGKGFEEDTKHVDAKIRKWGNRVKRYSCAPDEIHAVYKSGDIALVPTLYSEGTSLSCLEALSSGNAVISSRIGGLTDIIIDRYNGLLIEPNKDSLHKAVEALLADPALMRSLKEKGLETSRAFSKKHWKEKWSKIIRKSIQDPMLSGKLEVAEVYCAQSKGLSDSVKELAGILLQQGYLVYLRKPDNELRMRSFGRLQFIDNDEVLYTPADLSVHESGAVGYPRDSVEISKFLTSFEYASAR